MIVNVSAEADAIIIGIKPARKNIFRLNLPNKSKQCRIRLTDKNSRNAMVADREPVLNSKTKFTGQTSKKITRLPIMLYAFREAALS